LSLMQPDGLFANQVQMLAKMVESHVR